MAPTSEERREVAARLRGLDMSDIEVDGCIIDSPKYVGLLLMRMLDAACDYRDGLRYFPGFFSAQAVVELFADLTDPICHIVLRQSDSDFTDEPHYICSRCDKEGIDVYERDDYTLAGIVSHARYCSNCGARVVD